MSHLAYLPLVFFRCSPMLKVKLDCPEPSTLVARVCESLPVHDLLHFLSLRKLFQASSALAPHGTVNESDPYQSSSPTHYIVVTRFLVAMSTSDTRHAPVKSRLGARFAPVLLFVLTIPLAFIAGTVTQEPLAAAGLAAGAFSITCGVLVVAPIAGRLAKERFLVSLARPDEIDEQMMLEGVGQIVHKMGVIAENPETAGLFGPLFEAYTRQLDASYQGIVNNIRSQASSGKGAFDLGDLTEEEIGREFEGILMERVEGVISPFLGNMGATERGKQIVNAKIMLALRSGGNGGKTNPAATWSGASTGKGVDFRRG